MKLVFHPDHPPLAVRSIEASVWREGSRWHFRYIVEGAGGLVMPEPRELSRAGDLWRTTCFEAFVGGEGDGYREYNFSPSGQWAAYNFDAPRKGMRAADDSAQLWLEDGADWIAVEAAVSADLAPDTPLGMTAVIEEDGGHKSYWALAHPKGSPDFHQPSCFLARLPE